MDVAGGGSSHVDLDRHGRTFIDVAISHFAGSASSYRCSPSCSISRVSRTPAGTDNFLIGVSFVFECFDRLNAWTWHTVA